ncbi:UNVERIFIED_CONTAM: hypothetical protein FKN15_008868 [Acipenser sinensis]
MTQQGAALQTYNNELVKCSAHCSRGVSSGIEELCSKREELNRQILQEEEEKTKLQNDIRILTEKLSRILESSQTLLNVLKREAGSLSKGTLSHSAHKDS